MDWLQADIYTNTNGIEPVTGRLLDLGITGFVIKDAEDFINLGADRLGTSRIVKAVKENENE